VTLAKPTNLLRASILRYLQADRTLLNGTLFQRDASMVKGSFAGFCRAEASVRAGVRMRVRIGSGLLHTLLMVKCRPIG